MNNRKIFENNLNFLNTGKFLVNEHTKRSNEMKSMLNESGGGFGGKILRLMRDATDQPGRFGRPFWPRPSNVTLMNQWFRSGVSIIHGLSRYSQGMWSDLVKISFGLHFRNPLDQPQFFGGRLVDIIVSPNGTTVLRYKFPHGGNGPFEQFYDVSDEGLREILPGRMPLELDDGTYVFPEDWFDNPDNWGKLIEADNPSSWRQWINYSAGLGFATVPNLTVDADEQEIIPEPPPGNPREPEIPEFLTRPGQDWHPPMR